MADIDSILKRQERWQKERRFLSWPEKVRLAEAVRESLARFRQAGPPVEPLRNQGDLAGQAKAEDR